MNELNSIKRAIGKVEKKITKEMGRANKNLSDSFRYLDGQYISYRLFKDSLRTKPFDMSETAATGSIISGTFLFWLHNKKLISVGERLSKNIKDNPPSLNDVPVTELFLDSSFPDYYVFPESDFKSICGFKHVTIKSTIDNLSSYIIFFNKDFEEVSMILVDDSKDTVHESVIEAYTDENDPIYKMISYAVSAILINKHKAKNPYILEGRVNRHQSLPSLAKTDKLKPNKTIKYQSLELMKISENKTGAESKGGSVSPHVRQSHWKRVRYGKGRKLVRWIFIPTTFVNYKLNQ